MLSHTANLFNTPEYLLSLPVILLALFAAGILLIDSVTPQGWKWMNAATAMAGVLFSAAGVIKIQIVQARLEETGRRLQWAFEHTILFDHLSIYFSYLLLAGAAISILTSYQRQPSCVQQAKIYSLILLSVAGMMGMAAGFDIVIIFVGFGLTSVCTSLLIMWSERERGTGAGMKHFLRGAVSPSVFGVGLCLLWGTSGSTNLQLISQALQSIERSHLILARHAAVIVALAFIVAGAGFKIAVMPFHRWLLDVCESLPPGTAGFVVALSQTAGWAALLRILLWGMYPLRSEYVPMLTVLAVLSMLGANIAGLTQTSLARLLGYSSIAQGVFIILGMVSLASVHYPDPAFFEGFKALLFYLAAYMFMNLGAFAVVAAVRQTNMAEEKETDGINGIAGLFYCNRGLAIVMTIFLCSLAGIPLSAGFYGKYFVFRSLFGGGHYVLAGMAIVSSFVALYYYGRLAQVMFVRYPRAKVFPAGVPVKTALGILSLVTVAFSIYPKPFISAVEWSLRLT